jgi:hypothetical protein
MTDILVTKAAVRKLAASLASTDTRSLRHTERLALIAQAFGWKEDAFMHALKAQRETETPTPNGYFVAFPWVTTLGVTPSTSAKIEALMKKTIVEPGLIVVGGPTGSGKTTTVSALSRYLEDAGYPTIDGMANAIDWGVEYVFDWMSKAARKRFLTKRTIVISEIRSLEVMRLAREFVAQGNVVIAGMATSTAPNALKRLSSMMNGDTSCIRGVIVQRIARKTCNCSETCGPDDCNGYRGRFAVMDIVEPQSLPEGYFDEPRFYEGLALSVAEAIQLEMTDLSEGGRLLDADTVAAALQKMRTRRAHRSPPFLTDRAV